MNPDRYEEEIISSIDQKNNYEKIVEINGVFLGYKKTEKSVANVIVAAAITAKARIKLYKGILEVIKNNGRLIYTDTDSIIAAFKKTKDWRCHTTLGAIAACLIKGMPAQRDDFNQGRDTVEWQLLRSAAWHRADPRRRGPCFRVESSH